MSKTQNKAGQQLSIFDERQISLESANRALSDFNLAEALRLFESCLQRFPNDTTIRLRHDAVYSYYARLQTLKKETQCSLKALFYLGDELPTELRKGWNKRMAIEVERQLGACGTISGKPIGLFWLAADEIQKAVRSMRESLIISPNDARLHGYLGDALLAMNEKEAARIEYLHAFIIDPWAVDLIHLADQDILDIISSAVSEYEIAGDSLDWVAAVGTVEGLFPVLSFADFNKTTETCNRADMDRSRPGHAFYSLILNERADRNKITYRQAMKKLCPLLFQAFLERYG